MNTLVIDIGGTNVKIWNAAGERTKFPSGKRLTPERFLREIMAIIRHWEYDRLSIGYAGHVIGGRLAADPYNLGPGWVAFDWAGAFDRPVRIMNDACMQALGSYEGGRMLYLGLGTSIGTALIIEGTIVTMALGHLQLGKSSRLDERTGRDALKKLGVKRWSRGVIRAGLILKDAFLVDHVVFGGGNARRLRALPKGFRIGGNENAFRGGVRMWERPPAEPGDPNCTAWIVPGAHPRADSIQRPVIELGT